MARWKKWDRSQSNCYHIRPNDVFYYAREHESGGYEKSECNRLISNFKKSPSRRGLRDWKYKERAAKQFARELVGGLCPEIRYSVCCIPPSKVRTDSKYDDRFDMVFRELKQLRPDIEIEEPVACQISTDAVSTGGGDRSPDFVQSNYEWNGFRKTPENIVVIDDVITTGGHYVAFLRMLEENGYGETPRIGMFWAKHIWRPTETFEIDLTQLFSSLE